MTGLLTAFFAQMVIVTYRSFAGGGIQREQAPLPLPLPSDYTAPIMIYGALSLVPGEGQRVAGMIGWGFVLATLLNLWEPTTGRITTAAGNAQVPMGQTPSGNPLPATRISSL